MEFTIEAEPGGAFVIVKVRGEITRRDALRFDHASHAFGQERGIDRYLIDVTEATNVDPPSSTYEFAYRDLPATWQCSRSACLAVLVSRGDHSHDFVECVCRNAGFPMTIFVDRESAERHLRGRTA